MKRGIRKRSPLKKSRVRKTPVSRLKCKNGYYKRSSYKRRVKGGKLTTIKESCVKRSSVKSRVRIGPLRKGTLTSFGYNTKSPAKERRKSIEKAIKNEGALPVYRKLNAVAVLNRNRNPLIAKKLLADRNWVGKNYGFKATK